jgi:hypothetical protein
VTPIRLVDYMFCAFATSTGRKFRRIGIPEDENITVLTGTFLVGMGDHFDEGKLKAMHAGDFASIPKEMRHFAIAKGETVYQVHGIGPFKVNWVNPADVAANDVSGHE